MDYFDLHCDTITALYSGQKDTHITPKKAACYNKYSQMFAIWMNDSETAQTAFEKAKNVASYYSEYIKTYKNAFFQPFLTLENGVGLGDDLNNIEFWKNTGIKAVTLTWNGDNSLGFGAFSGNESGLTTFGKNVVIELQKSGILVDISHLNERGFYDCLRLAKAPIIATHSNCFSLCDSKRNLKDDQIRELFSLGGIMGICFYPEFLGRGDIFELIYEHIYHALELGGENSVCFGSDFDGAKMNGALDSIEKVKSVYMYLSQKGFDKSLLEKIFYKNAGIFFNNVLHA